MINSVNAQFNGTIGYAANWDNYNNANVTNTIWEHPAIDYIGIDSYFQNLLTNSQADNSGTYPNIGFITEVENAWNDRLDNVILPFAAARKGGTGMPIEFTEVGYLPYNRTTVNPQNGSGTLDQDEQNMAFEGLMRALDGRRASGEFLATHIWQWDMQGSAGSQWNMNPNGGNQPSNQQTAQWLSSFANGTNVDPSGEPSLPGQTRILYSFENGLQGFFYPDFDSEPASTLERVTGIGATDGSYSLKITKPTEAWTWDVRVEMAGSQLDAVQQALLDEIDNYILEIDVTYVADDLPPGISSLDMHVSFDSNLDPWSQSFPYAAIGSATDQTVTVEIPLGEFELTPGLSDLDFHLGFQGNWPGSASALIYIDRIALRDTVFDKADGDFNGDGIVDAADFTVWRDTFGSSIDLRADADRDGLIGQSDYFIWQDNFGAVAGSTARTVPEPSSFILVLIAALALRRTR